MNGQDGSTAEFSGKSFIHASGTAMVAFGSLEGAIRVCYESLPSPMKKPKGIRGEFDHCLSFFVASGVLDLRTKDVLARRYRALLKIRNLIAHGPVLKAVGGSRTIGADASRMESGVQPPAKFVLEVLPRKIEIFDLQLMIAAGKADHLKDLFQIAYAKYLRTP